jgi:hypothetical protein
VPAFSISDWLRRVVWGERPDEEPDAAPRVPDLMHGEFAPVQINHARVKGGPRKLDSGGFYVTVRFPCGVCGEEFLLTPAAQKYILEERGVPRTHLGQAAFCATCLPLCGERNRIRRALGAIALERSAILRSLSVGPPTPELLIGSARTRVVLSAVHSSGDLDGAITDARRARKIDPSRKDAMYWEARALELSGKSAEARALFTELCAEPAPAEQPLALLQRDARERLEAPVGTVLPDRDVPSAKRLAELEAQIEARTQTRDAKRPLRG